MSKFNLTEAAKDILHGNVASKQSGQDKPAKLSGDVAYGTKEAGDIGTQVTKTTDGKPDATRGTPTATAPGAKPPVGSEPAHHLDADKNKQSLGRQDLVNSEEGDEKEAQDNSSIVARVAAKLAPQKMQANKGATFQSYGEESEVEGEMVTEEEEEDEKHEDEKEDKKLIKKMMRQEKMKEKMKEDMDALLSGENLSEEFTTKATTIFEAAVVARAEEVIAEAVEDLQEEFQLAVEEVRNDLAAKLDDYMNYMAEEWFKENQLAIEHGLRAEIVEEFISGMKNLFVEHYIDIPEEKVDVVNELVGRVEELEEELNEQIQSAVELKKELNESKKLEAIHTACEGLTQTQVEKMKSLAEGIEFTTEEEFAGKLETLKESYFKTPVKAADSSALNEGVIVEDEKKAQPASQDPSIDFYAQTISKTLVK